MKTIELMTLSVLSIFLISSTGCQKYEDGPAFSLRSKKARVANTWEIAKAIEDGNDVTNRYEQYEVEFKTDGDARLKAIYSTGGATIEFETDGTWEFSNQKENLVMDMEDDNADETYQILKLKENELWLRELGGEVELQLEPK